MLIALALLAKILVPTGFMPTAAKDGTITVRICSGQMLEPATVDIAIPGLPPKHDNGSQKTEMPCAFAGLAMAMLEGIDPTLLALALAFVFALALRPTAPPRLSQPAYLRPPLRGPPSTL